MGARFGSRLLALARQASALPLQDKPWHRRCVIEALALGIAGVGLSGAVERATALRARSGLTISRVI
jgi:hypothetical protein